MAKGHSGTIARPLRRGPSHLQAQGLDHGGASDARQGAQLVRLLEDIEGAGCAGSLLFALFDEWFKTSWLLAATEQPRDRDPLWHNWLDPEEGYGLIAFDPEPAIRVDGDPRDWRGIAPYGRPMRGVPGLGRPVRALYVTSDQSRLYLRLDVFPGALHGQVRGLGIALDMLDPRRGDTRLPAPLDATWSRGAEFVLLIDPAARPGPRAELFCDRRMSWSAFARVRDGDTLAVHEAPLGPVANDDGLYLPLIVSVNRVRVSRTGEVYPAIHLDRGRLARGREARPGRGARGDSLRDYDPGAEWWLDRARGVIEIALPWGLLDVGDPSSLAVLDDRPGTDEIEVTRTGGIGLLAWATRIAGARADSLGPSRAGARRARPSDCQFVGGAGTTQSVAGNQVSVTSPDSISHLWNGWQRPITEERVKRSADTVRRAFEERASRDARYQGQFNAFEQGSGARRRPRRPDRRARAGGRHARGCRPRAAGLAAVQGSR